MALSHSEDGTGAVYFTLTATEHQYVKSSYSVGIVAGRLEIPTRDHGI
jgi:hypothetical protein